MPIYAYRCASCGHAKDVLQKFSDPLLTTCPSCGAESFRKQLTAAGFQLKGSGWYVTDFKGGPPAAKPDAAQPDVSKAEGVAAADSKQATESAPAKDASSPAAKADASPAPATPAPSASSGPASAAQ